MDSEIVIAGVACRFPGLDNAQRFAEFAKVPDAKLIYPRVIAKDGLDTSQFCVHAHQAENCDPQIRILLHCAREALCDAGINLTPTLNTAQGKKPVIGCVVSCEISDFGESVGYDIPALSGYGVLGGCRAMIANRISFECNLTGPSYTVASGNSLVAVHNAVNLIRDGRCDVVIVGAIELNIKTSYTRVVKMLDPEIERSEGGGIIVITRRGEANKVYGTIENTWLRFVGSCNDGEVKRGMESIWKTVADNNQNGERLHPVQVLGDNSWKRNIGHMEAKLLEGMTHETPFEYQLHGTIARFGDLGPVAGFTTLLLAVFQKPAPIPATFITACGLTGSYCIIKYKGAVSEHLPSGVPRYLAVAAQNSATVQNIMHCYRNSSHKARLYDNLNMRFRSGSARGIYDYLSDTTETGTTQSRPLWLVVGGVGANWEGMGQSLMKIPGYSSSVTATKNLLNSCSDSQISGSVYEMLVSLLTFQIAHIDLLKSLGVKFEGIMGHSFGEIGALYAAGTITREQAVKCAVHRASSVEKSAEGAMLAVTLPAQMPDIRGWIGRRLSSFHVDLACLNSSKSFVISGDQHEVEKARLKLEGEGVRCTLLKTHNKAFHSRHMLPVSAFYKESLDNIFPTSLSPPSNFHSTSQQGTFQIDADYFVTNMTEQVRFYDTYISRIPKDAVVLELSPHPMFCRGLEHDIPGVMCIPLSLRNTEQHRTAQRNTEQQHGDQLLKALKQIHLTSCSLDLRILGEEEEEEVNTGSLLSWDTSQSWYVPEQEHFPVLGTPRLQEQPHALSHFSLDVSRFDLNEIISGSEMMLDLMRKLAQIDDNKAFILSGEKLKSSPKRSSNNFVDVFILQNKIEVIYNGFLMLSGSLVRTTAVKKCSSLLTKTNYEACLQQIIVIETKYEINEMSLFFNIQPTGPPPDYNVISNSAYEIVAIWRGSPKIQQVSRHVTENGMAEESVLIKQTKKLLGVNMVSDQSRKLIEFGLDSLMTVELIEILRGLTGREFNNSDVMNLSFKDLAELNE